MCAGSPPGRAVAVRTLQPANLPGFAPRNLTRRVRLDPRATRPSEWYEVVLSRLGLLTVIAWSAIPVGASPGHAASRGCAPARSVVLVAKGASRVYKTRDRHVSVCNSRLGVREVFGDEGFVIFDPPAIALAGTKVGYGLGFLAEPEFDTPTEISVHDFADAGPRDDASYPALPNDLPAAQVTALKLLTSGRAVWIACESSVLPPPPRYVRGSECAKPSRIRYVVRSATKRTNMLGGIVVLDSGKRIRALSLRLSGRVASWRNGGTRRRARLPA